MSQKHNFKCDPTHVCKHPNNSVDNIVQCCVSNTDLCLHTGNQCFLILDATRHGVMVLSCRFVVFKTPCVVMDLTRLDSIHDHIVQITALTDTQWNACITRFPSSHCLRSIVSYDSSRHYWFRTDPFVFPSLYDELDGNSSIVGRESQLATMERERVQFVLATSPLIPVLVAIVLDYIAEHHPDLPYAHVPLDSSALASRLLSSPDSHSVNEWVRNHCKKYPAERWPEVKRPPRPPPSQDPVFVPRWKFWITRDPHTCPQCGTHHSGPSSRSVQPSSSRSFHWKFWLGKPQAETCICNSRRACNRVLCVSQTVRSNELTERSCCGLSCLHRTKPRSVGARELEEDSCCGVSYVRHSPTPCPNRRVRPSDLEETSCCCFPYLRRRHVSRRNTATYTRLVPME